MLNCVQLRYLVCFFGTVLIAAFTALSGGSLVQVILAPAGGIALGLATSKLLLDHFKLPAAATWGEVLARAKKSKSKKA